MNSLLDEKLMAKKRDNTHQSRIINSKMPIFMQIASHHTTRQHASTVANKAGAAPASGIDTNLSVPNCEENLVARLRRIHRAADERRLPEVHSADSSSSSQYNLQTLNSMKDCSSNAPVYVPSDAAYVHIADTPQSNKTVAFTNSRKKQRN